MTFVLIVTCSNKVYNIVLKLLGIMFSKPNYLFHPYETSFLSFHGTNVLSNDNHTFSLITEIDLYDQPVQNCELIWKEHDKALKEFIRIPP